MFLDPQALQEEPLFRADHGNGHLNLSLMGYPLASVKEKPSAFDTASGFDPNPANLVVFHLHGHDEVPESTGERPGSS